MIYSVVDLTMNKTSRFVLLFGVVMIISYVGSKYYKSIHRDEQEEEQELIRKYLLKERKPKIWIYVERERNARVWSSFHGRMSDGVNNAYVEKCIESTRECNPEFEVVLLSDELLKSLLPVEEEEGKEAWLERSVSRLLRMYGGVIVPSTYYSYVGVSGWLWREKEVVVEVGDGKRLQGVPLQCRGKVHVQVEEGKNQERKEEWGSLEKAFVSLNRKRTKKSVEEDALRYDVGQDRSVDELLDVYPEYPNLSPQEKEAEIRAGRKGQYVSLEALQRRHKMEAKMYV